jgi:hypothetical protein
LRRFSVALVLLVVVAACGSGDDDATTTAAATTRAAEAQATDAFGEFEREVTQAEIDRKAEKSQPEGWEPPPPGTHRLTLSSGTIVVTFSDGFSIGQEVTVTGDTLTIGPYIGEGAFCRDDRDSSYNWEIAGEELVLSPSMESCGDREAVLTGTWTKTG